MLIHLPTVGVHTTAAGCSLAPLLTGTALAVPRAVTNNIHHRPQSNCQLAALLALLCSTNKHSGTYESCHTTCHDALAWVPHNDLHPHTLCSWPRGVFSPRSGCFHSPIRHSILIHPRIIPHPIWPGTLKLLLPPNRHGLPPIITKQHMHHFHKVI